MASSHPSPASRHVHPPSPSQPPSLPASHPACQPQPLMLAGAAITKHAQGTTRDPPQPRVHQPPAMLGASSKMSPPAIGKLSPPHRPAQTQPWRALTRQARRLTHGPGGGRSRRGSGRRRAPPGCASASNTSLTLFSRSLSHLALGEAEHRPRPATPTLLPSCNLLTAPDTHPLHCSRAPAHLLASMPHATCLLRG